MPLHPRAQADSLEAGVAQAEAVVAGAKAAIDNLKAHKPLQHAEIAQAENGVIAIQADVERTELEEVAPRRLVSSTYDTLQRLEQAVADQKRLKANLPRSQTELDAQRRKLAVLDTQESQLRGDLNAKDAALDLANIALGYTEIVAPVDGTVGEREVRAGQYVRPGVQVISVVPLDTVWVVANYKKTQLTRVVPSQSATITVDSFPGTTVVGVVDIVSPASRSQFSLLPPDKARATSPRWCSAYR